MGGGGDWVILSKAVHAWAMTVERVSVVEFVCEVCI